MSLENQGRFITFLILSTLILIVYSYFFNPSSPAPVPGTSSSNPPTLASPVPAVPSSAVARQEILAKSPAISSQPKASSSVAAMAVTVETSEYVAVFSNRGALLTSFELKKYKNRETKKLIQLVHPDVDQPKPFASSCSSLSGLSELTYEVVGTSKKLTEEGESYSLTFRGAAAGGVVVEKIFRFTNGNHLLGYEIAVKNYGSKELPSSTWWVEWTPTLGLEEFTGTQSNAGGMRVATMVGGKLLTEKPKKVSEAGEIKGPISWTALIDQFFVAALIPDSSSGVADAKVARDYNAYMPATGKSSTPVLDPKQFAPRPILSYAVPALKRGEGYSRSGRVFLGPQEYEKMKSLNIQLERVVDFGMFGFISVYMLKLLKWFYQLFSNWGVAIILLSILVKLILWWPTHSSYIQMAKTQRKMKEMQPQLESLKKRYAGDSQKLNQETMALYQKAGINPTAGCLPMLLQIPVFFALYATLVHTIELRGAPFFFWITDLSLRDSFYVFPILMGITMIVQQRVSGQMNGGISSGQQKFMMWFFPVFLTAISMQWPAGLLLYWVVTNLLSILQQQMVNRHLKKARA